MTQTTTPPRAFTPPSLPLAAGSFGAAGPQADQAAAVIQKTIDFVKNTPAGDKAGHDWWHTYRVWQTAIALAKGEGGNLYTIQLAALLHDIADWKFVDNHDDDRGPAIARHWLTSCAVAPVTINHVCSIIKDMSFKGAGVTTTMKTLEGMIVQDADRLDALGAIGIARTFAYGGLRQRELYNPAIKPEKHSSFDAYKKSSGPTINHFYEKLLLLKDRMNTASARRLAIKRHEVMENFLAAFFIEWYGNE
jgi:uncharacterized protein